MTTATWLQPAKDEMAALAYIEPPCQATTRSCAPEFGPAAAAASLFAAGLAAFFVMDHRVPSAVLDAVSPAVTAPVVDPAPDVEPLAPFPFAAAESDFAPVSDGLVVFRPQEPASAAPAPAPAAAIAAQPASGSAIYSGEPRVEIAAPKQRLQSNSWFALRRGGSALRGGFAALAEGLVPIPAAQARAALLQGLVNAPIPAVDTDERVAWAQTCAQRSNFRCSVDALGRSVIQEARGRKLTHLAYDASLPVALRNTTLVQLPNGQRAVSVDTPQIAEPLVFDMTGQGVRTSNRTVMFDITGQGRNVRIHDIGSGSAVLVFDADGDGIAGENGRELFGFFSSIRGGRDEFYMDGFEALAEFVKKAEEKGVLAKGALARRRLDAGDLERLHRAYGFGLRVGGVRTRTLSPREAGVAEIALSDSPSRRLFNFDGQGDDVMRRDGATFVRADGGVRSYEDVFFAFDLNARLAAVSFDGRRPAGM